MQAKIRIEAEFIKPFALKSFPVLRADLLNITQFRAACHGAVKLLDELISHPSNGFWSTIALEPQLIRVLDEITERLPYFCDLKAGGCAYGCDLEEVIINVYEKLWVVFLRIFVTGRAEDVTPDVMKDLNVRYKILTLARLRKFTGLFAATFYPVMKRVVHHLKQTVPQLFSEFKADITAFTSTLSQFCYDLTKISKAAESGERRSVADVANFLDQLYIMQRELTSWCEIFRVCREFLPIDDLVVVMGAVADTVGTKFSDKVIVNLAVGGHQLIPAMHRRLTYYLQGLTQLCLRFYENYPDERDKIHFIAAIAASPELFLRVDDVLTYRDLVPYLDKKTELHDISQYIIRTLDRLRAIKSVEIVDQLRSWGLLDHLGVLKNQEIKQRVDELSDIVPHSKRFLHLALRHFGYNAETTLHSIVDADNCLPYPLRLLARHCGELEDAANSASKSTLPIIADTFDVESGEDSDAEDEGAEKDGEDALAAAARMTAEDEMVSLMLGASVSMTPSESGKSTMTLKELRAQRTEDRLRRLVAKSAGVLNMAEVQLIAEKLESSKKKEPVVFDVDGKKFTKLYNDGPAEELNPMDKVIIKDKMRSLKYELSDEDDEDGRYDLDERFRKEVGASGRFNNPDAEERPSIRTIGVRAMEYDDEYIDSYDDAPFSVETTEAMNEEKNDADKDLYGRRIIEGPLGPPRIRLEGLKENPNPQRRIQAAINSRAQKKKAEREQARQQAEEASSSKPVPPSSTKQKSATQKEPNEKEGAQKQQPKGREGGYTGGKGRLMKERHKGQFKQRGADRKMQRTANFD